MPERVGGLRITLHIADIRNAIAPTTKWADPRLNSINYTGEPGNERCEPNDAGHRAKSRGPIRASTNHCTVLDLMDCFLKMSRASAASTLRRPPRRPGRFRAARRPEILQVEFNAATSAGANVEVAAGGGGGGPELSRLRLWRKRKTHRRARRLRAEADRRFGRERGRGTGRAASACSMRCNWRTAIAMPTSRRPPTAAIVPGVTTSAPKVPSGRITPDATRTNPATAVAAPKTSKNSDITLIPAPVRCPQVSYTHSYFGRRPTGAQG